MPAIRRRNLILLCSPGPMNQSDYGVECHASAVPFLVFPDVPVLIFLPLQFLAVAAKVDVDARRVLWDV